MTILGVDISHFQGNPNFSQVKASGRSFVVQKATESTTFTDPTLAANRRAAHAAGLIFGAYHFARATNAAAEAAYFLRALGPLQPGEFLVLDWEVPGADPVGWCHTWLDTVYAATGVRPLIYMNSSTEKGSNWTPITADYGLWLAKYDNAPDTQTAVAHWPFIAMKQYTDRATVPGISGGVDADSFFGTTTQLLAYGKQSTTPTPTPVPVEDPVTLNQDDADAIFNAALFTDDFGTPSQRTVRFRDVLNELRNAAANPPVADPPVAATVDPAALAAALLADADAVAKLGDAIAAGLVKRVHD